MNECSSSIFNLIKTTGDLANAAEKLELILDFNKIITIVLWVVRVLGSINTTWHHDSKRNKISNDLVDDVTDTIFTRVRLNGWVELNFTVFKVNLDVEDWWAIVVPVVSN